MTAHVDRIPAVPRTHGVPALWSPEPRAAQEPRVTVADRTLYGRHAELIVAARAGWHLDEPEPADPPAGWLLGGFFWGCVLLVTAVWGWFLVARVLPKAAGLAVEAARMTGAW